jgi:hypothetical protein
MARRRNGKRMGKRVVQVREDGDSMAAKIDRTISGFRMSESTTTIVVKTSFDLVTGTTVVSTTFTFPDLVLTDDFISFAQQYNTFKVKSMRFDVFHTNPASTAPVAVSTLHCNFSGQPPTTWLNESAVVDGPDSMYIEAGSKKQTFYWNAKGTAELEYQDVNTFNNHGGLRCLLRATTPAGVTAGIVVVSAVITFRGRH